MNDLIFALIFFLPAGIANASPVVANKIPVLRNWSTPIDFGKSHNGKRLLGDNKRWRGLTVGVLVGAAVNVLLYILLPSFYANIIQSVSAAALLGALLGFGALAGDAIESYFKRRANVAAGEPWFPFDQLDFIIGGLLASAPIARLSTSQYLAMFIVWLGMHLLWSYIGFILKLKEKPL